MKVAVTDQTDQWTKRADLDANNWLCQYAFDANYMGGRPRWLPEGGSVSIGSFRTSSGPASPSAQRPGRVDYGHSNRSEGTSHKSLEANTTSSERAPADAPRSKRCCPRENGSPIKVFLRRFSEGFLSRRCRTRRAYAIFVCRNRPTSKGTAIGGVTLVFRRRERPKVFALIHKNLLIQSTKSYSSLLARIIGTAFES